MKMTARHRDRAGPEIGWPPIYLKDHLAFKEFKDFAEIVSNLKEIDHQQAQQKEP